MWLEGSELGRVVWGEVGQGAETRSELCRMEDCALSPMHVICFLALV